MIVLKIMMIISINDGNDNDDNDHRHRSHHQHCIIIVIAIMMGVKGVEQLPLIASIGLSHHALQQKAFVGRGWVVMMVKRG